MTEIIAVVDRVEEKEANKYKLITKTGDEYTIGKVLNDRINEFQSGIAVKLTMDSYNNFPYIKDFAKCIDLTPEKIKELSKPAKNPRDISIEAQVAVKAIIDLMAHSIPVTQDLEEMTMIWIRNALKDATE
ncbi:MAG: hypothetical protein WC516_08000 [Patescibacteria group bacterium]